MFRFTIYVQININILGEFIVNITWTYTEFHFGEGSTTKNGDDSLNIIVTHFFNNIFVDIQTIYYYCLLYKIFRPTLRE